MAQAVTGASADSGAADWSGEDVSPAEVVRRLADLSRDRAETSGYTMACSANLIVTPTDADIGDGIQKRLIGLGHLCPSRIVRLRSHDHDRVDADIGIWCGTDGERLGPCHEWIVLTADANRLHHADSLVRPLTTRGLTVFVWTPAPHRPAVDSKVFALADRVVIDSRNGDPLQALKDARQCTRSAVIHDMAWLRQENVRACVAAAYDTPDRPILTGAEELDVTTTGRSVAPGLLLCGWIAGRLMWEIDELDATSVERWSGRAVRPDGGETKVTVRAAPQSASVDSVETVRFSTGGHVFETDGGAPIHRRRDFLAEALTPIDDFVRGYDVALRAILRPLERSGVL